MSAAAIRTLTLVSALALVALRHFTPWTIAAAVVVLIVGATAEVVRHG